MRKTVELYRKERSGPSRVTIADGYGWHTGNVTAYVETTVGSASIAMSPEEVRELIETLSEFLEK
tara:strand:+ start:178 stop:372 length:195 start_codon:yes stop_codon:yes gene_type:complete